jgi:ATP-dependent DNA helicase RecQ
MTPQEVLQTRFGFPAFREGQEPVIARLLSRKSTVAIFPTGAGKSLCYQLPALMLDGLTLVISPLIALMKDQIDFLTSKGIEAARYDSSLTADESRGVLQKLREGKLKLLYIAPERLANERFVQAVSRTPVALMAIDEAHCISEWGHNFRPDYLRLSRSARQLNVQRVLCLTATATPDVATQIAKAFDIESHDVISTGFYRPNLSLMVTPVDDGDRINVLIERLRRRAQGPSVVYVTLQKTAELVAWHLKDAGFDAAAYHAGMDAEARNAVQDHFMQSTGSIVVATIAFGMGIDKSNIRYVYHFNLPKSLENYAQEIGRAGRDGKPSVCELLFCPIDRITLDNFSFGDTPDAAAVGDFVRHILSQPTTFDISVYDLSQQFDTRPLVVETLLTYLELLDVIEPVGAFYTEYKFIWTKDRRQVIAGFDAARQQFLNALLSHSRPGKKWTFIDLHKAAEQMNTPRDRLVKAMHFLADDLSAIELETAGARQGFRRTPTPVDAQPLVDQLTQRFHDREARDIDRMDQVCGFAKHQGCLTQKLVQHFGQPFDHDCGHCGWCKNYRPAHSEYGEHVDITASDKAVVDEVLIELQNQLESPRQLARFLCGINSPRLTRAKLSKHAQFGSLSHVPYRQLLQLLESLPK